MSSLTHTEEFPELKQKQPSTVGLLGPNNTVTAATVWIIQGQNMQRAGPGPGPGQGANIHPAARSYTDPSLSLCLSKLSL